MKNTLLLPKVRGEILENGSLSKYSWFQVGGNAEVIFKPADLDDLQNFLKNIDKNIPITVIGGGSNLLIRDGGVDGVVIILKDTFKNIELKNNIRPISHRIYLNLLLTYTFKLYKHNKLSTRFQFLHQNTSKFQKYLTTSRIYILPLLKFLKISRLFCKNCFLWKNSVGNKSIEVECGVLNSKLYDFAKKNEIGNYEFIGTIPGTVGGAIRGNAGCYGSETKDILISVTAIDLNGNIKVFSKDECNFEYRKNNLPNDLIFIKANLKADYKKSLEDIENTYNEMIQKRNSSQPQGVKTCGSTFKNMPDMPAWKVVQQLGYQNREIDGAKMSEKHANFMVNTGNATAKSLESLGELIRAEARDKLNINLEWEIKIIGNK